VLILAHSEYNPKYNHTITTTFKVAYVNDLDQSHRECNIGVGSDQVASFIHKTFLYRSNSY
jgi:hypothetical protein